MASANQGIRAVMRGTAFIRFSCAAFLLVLAGWVCSYFRSAELVFSRRGAQWRIASSHGWVILDNEPQRLIENGRIRHVQCEVDALVISHQNIWTSYLTSDGADHGSVSLSVRAYEARLKRMEAAQDEILRRLRELGYTPLRQPYVVSMNRSGFGNDSRGYFDIESIAMRSGNVPVFLRSPPPPQQTAPSSFSVPDVAVVVATGIFPAVVGARRRRTRAWQRRGQCLQCGYDLRESPDVCPECGTPRGRF